MKNLKKLLAILLMLTMVLSIPTIARAEEENSAPVVVEKKEEPKAEKKEEPKEEKKEEKKEEPKAEKTEEPKAEPESKPEPKKEEKVEEPKVEAPKAEVTPEPQVEVAPEPAKEENKSQATEEVTDVIFEEEEVPMSDGLGIDISRVAVEIKVKKPDAQIGDSVELTAVIKTDEDLSGYKLKYQWQIDKNDGKGYQDIEKKAKKETYKFKLTEKNIHCNWRVQLKIA